MGVVLVDDVHKLTYYIAAKQLAAFPSPDEWNSYANFANIDLYNYYNDERQKQLVRVKQGESIFIPPVLSCFVQYNVDLTQTGNIIQQPGDYQYDLQMTSASLNLFKKVDYDKVTNYLNSTIDAPTSSNPIFVELSDTFVIYPTVTDNQLTYLSIPNTVKWAYTVVNGRPVYDAENSINFQFDGTEIYRLTVRILKYMGISMRDDEVIQVANDMINTAS